VIFVHIQVIGELSNAGQPMRRFVQSFVLAPQTANKYYVHVDIFRYQDENVSTPDAEEEEEKYEEGRP
jgi:Ras GTPase-activating protein-binding protein 1